MPNMNGFILFAHGSSDPNWSQPIRRVAERAAERLGHRAIALAFLERQPPSLEEAAAGLIDQGADAITVIPIFLGIGGHLKNDLPRLIDDVRDRWETVDFQLASPIGEAETVLDAIAGYVISQTGAA
jgi:sirohydrochlorin cobaltochelatase